MSSPKLVAPGRLEDLLAGAFPEAEPEARLQGLARELRSASWSSAPRSLRERIGALGAHADARGRVVRWRLAVVLAGCALAAGLFALTNLGSFGSGAGGGASGQTVGGGGSELRASTPPLVGDQSGEESSDGLKNAESSSLPVPGGRAQDVDMWMNLRVKDAEGVSDAVHQAQTITRDLGGIVVSQDVATQGKQGRAQVVLKIPVGNVQEANDRLSDLGTITGQRVNTVDLQGQIDHQASRIQHLRSAIRIELVRLASGQLDPVETLRAQIHLEHLRRNLRDVLRERAALAARAAMADLTLRLATPSGAGPQKSEGGISGAADKAVDLLRGAGAVAVFLGLVLSPVVLLVVLAWLALRARNRRLEARLLDEARPGRPAERPSP